MLGVRHLSPYLWAAVRESEEKKQQHTVHCKRSSNKEVIPYRSSFATYYACTESYPGSIPWFLSSVVVPLHNLSIVVYLVQQVMGPGKWWKRGKLFRYAIIILAGGVCWLFSPRRRRVGAGAVV